MLNIRPSGSAYGGHIKSVTVADEFNFIWPKPNRAIGYLFQPCVLPATTVPLLKSFNDRRKYE